MLRESRVAGKSKTDGEARRSLPVCINEEIKPVDGRFCSGPGKVRPEAVQALAAVATTYLGTSHRQKTVRDQVARLRARLFARPAEACPLVPAELRRRFD